MTILTFIVIGLLATFGVAAFMEFYKKGIRKGNAKTWENWVIGAALSIGVSVLLCLTGLVYPIFSQVIINIAIYAVVIFCIQLFVDMKIIKKMIVMILGQMDVTKLFNTVLGKLGLSAATIATVLKFMGKGETELRKALLEAGLPEEKVNEIILAIFGAKAEAKAE